MSETSNGDTKEQYIAVEFENIIKYDDGSIDVVLTDGRINSNGYDAYDDLYRENMTAYKAYYNLEEKGIAAQ